MPWVGMIVALVVLGLLAGTILNFAPAFLALPVALVVGVLLLRGLRAEESPEEEEPERNRLGVPRQRFTERDRRTLT